jgi:hypothetical protein
VRANQLFHRVSPAVEIYVKLAVFWDVGSVARSYDVRPFKLTLGAIVATNYTVGHMRSLDRKYVAAKRRSGLEMAIDGIAHLVHLAFEWNYFAQKIP